MEVKFVVDHNVGKLAKWLRMMGYDALLFKEKDDGEMVKMALSEGRVILTKDMEVMKRRVVTSGRLKAVLIVGDEPESQLRQIASTLDLDYAFKPFSRCLECNEKLVRRDRDEVRDLVPPHVFQTQSQYVECPSCHRIYWQGTHWEAMRKQLEKFTLEKQEH